MHPDVELAYRALLLGSLAVFDSIIVLYSIYLLINGLGAGRRHFLSGGRIFDTLSLSAFWIFIYFYLYINGVDFFRVGLLWMARAMEQYDRFRGLRRAHERWRRLHGTRPTGPPGTPGGEPTTHFQIQSRGPGPRERRKTEKPGSQDGLAGKRSVA